MGGHRHNWTRGSLDAVGAMVDGTIVTTGYVSLGGRGPFGCLLTYSLGFFFGPGLPRGFGVPSLTPWPNARFVPAFGTPRPFFAEPSPRGGGRGPSAFGAGVEFASETLSADELVLAGTGAAGVDVAEEEDLFTLEFLRESGLITKRLSNSGETVSLTTLDAFEDLSDRLFVAGVEMEGEAGIDMMADGCEGE